ncbi:hypothetical protein B0J12DRAFT_777978 [Macrophomina phaseolina]|uniref:Amidohydrolase 1 n=1 Tax=Macrophomina phaseolina TaxID=35725 RepID=A0ABQ8GIB6_9PEZI|nr:hypothetical protein B0J12DRAFT_777978 [Macrophomina phaseolina]
MTPPTAVGLTTIDTSNCIITPGFVDGHNHMWRQLIRGIATEWSLFDYLTAYYAAALDLLDNGITTVLEQSHITNSPQRAAGGIRGYFCYGLHQNPPTPSITLPDGDLAAFDHATHTPPTPPARPCDTAHRQLAQRLADDGLLGPDLVFSHGVGAGVVATPDTELQMGMGLDVTANQNTGTVAQMRLALQMQRGLENQKGVSD